MEGCPRRLLAGPYLGIKKNVQRMLLSHLTQNVENRTRTLKTYCSWNL
ncbi:unnamed protein product, partial [Gulo gulo]